MHVLGISGSLRRESHNSRLLDAASRLLPADATYERFDAASLKAIPPFDADDELAGDPEAVVALKQAIERADVVLFATPEYNASIPGVLKNAVDWASRPVKTTVLRNKPVAVIGASTGMFGAVWAQAELRKVLGAAGARVLDAELPVALADDAFHEEHPRLADDEAHEALGDVVAQLCDAGQARRAQAEQRTAA
jgi:chromate reductase, NAD(P)H dehydrogenase (quinone)